MPQLYWFSSPGDTDDVPRLSEEFTSVRVGLVRRAKIVLLAAKDVGTSTVSVVKWWRRYEVVGMEGVMDATRPSRPQWMDQERIITSTLSATPGRLGSRTESVIRDLFFRWSSRTVSLRAVRLETSVRVPAHGGEGIDTRGRFAA